MLDALFGETEEKMDKALHAVERDLQGLRTGRASISLVDGVKVQAYGTETPINQTATISTPDPSTITIQPWDVSIIKSIEKAILQANLGMTPSNDGRVIRLNVPALTEERRREIVKMAHDIAEHGRIAVRNLRRQANDEIKKVEKEHKIGEDEGHRFIDNVQKKTDSHIAKIDALIAKKEKEIMQV